MNTTIRTGVLLGLVAVLGIGAGGSAIADETPGPTPPSASSTATALSTASIEMLKFSREEERMARDLYQALADIHDDARPMANITTSEQTHFDAIGAVLTANAIADPSAGRPSGSYAYPELQSLYDGWLARGEESLQSAHQVGIELEKRDIADLEKAIAAESNSSITAVYQRLLAGSENHLAAFERAAAGATGSQQGTSAKGTRGDRSGASGRQSTGAGSMQQRGSSLGQGQGGSGNAADCPWR